MRIHITQKGRDALKNDSINKASDLLLLEVASRVENVTPTHLRKLVRTLWEQCGSPEKAIECLRSGAVILRRES
jgi:hypothetical protein